ncbi:MAG: trigger factor, partial [Deltaproteobacteria bacterium]
MKVSLEDISSVKKKMIVNLPSDLVDKEIDNFYRELNRKVKIKGFRPGKVPRNILERYYKDVADREVA